MPGKSEAGTETPWLQATQRWQGKNLTPSEFYKRQDAEEALAGARWVYATVSEALAPGGA